MKFVAINFHLILYILCALFCFSRQKAKSIATFTRGFRLGFSCDRENPPYP